MFITHDDETGNGRVMATCNYLKVQMRDNSREFSGCVAVYFFWQKNTRWGFILAKFLGLFHPIDYWTNECDVKAFPKTNSEKSSGMAFRADSEQNVLLCEYVFVVV